MGLLGFFFSKRFLKLVFIVGSVFVLLQFSRLLISFASGLDLLLQAVLATLALLVPTFLAVRYERFRFLQSIMKFVCVAVVPLILVFSFVLPASIPSPLGAPVKLGAMILPFIAYIVYQRKRSIWTRSSTLGVECRRYGRLSKGALLPTALEEGHIVYDAGIKGFRVLRFIQMEGLQLDSVDEPAMTETQLQLEIPDMRELLPLIKRRGVEISYEFYLRNRALQGFIGITCEGRDYHEVRTTIDNLSKKLVHGSTTRRETPSITTSLVEDSARAERILTMPLSTTFEDLERIESDDYNAKVFSYSDSERPIRLRSVYMNGLSLVSQSQDIKVVEEFLQAAIAHKTLQDSACILHIKPLSDRTINRELVKASNTYQRAMTRYIEVIRNGFLDGKTKNKASILNSGKATLNPANIIEESKTALQRLGETEESGYFEVSLAIIAEPAVAESIARALKNRLAQEDSSGTISLIRAPPAVIGGVIRRDLALPLGRLNGKEIQSLLGSRNKSRDTTTDKNEGVSMRPSVRSFAERSVAPKQ